MTTRSGITLCLTVLNEAERLPALLRAAEGAYDELVVVDTGSTDDTVRLAEKAGARLVHHVWRDDFSAARNTGLEAASREWILVLDPDEAPGRGFAQEVRALVGNPSIGAATLRVVHQMPQGHRRQTLQLRLFRSAPEVRFHFPVREDVVRPVFRQLWESQQRLGAIHTPVLHHGFADPWTARAKKSRDLAILRHWLDDNPLDPEAHVRTMELARFWGDSALWAAAAIDTHRALEEFTDAELASTEIAGELIALMAEGLYDDDPGKQARLLDRFESRIPASSAFHLRRAECLERFAPARAAADFQQCIDRFGQPGDLQLSRVPALLGLARLHAARDELSEARRAVDAALKDEPRDPDALVAAFALARQTGGEAAVQRRAEELAASGEAAVDVEVAQGEAALLARRAAEARAAFERALRLEDASWIRARLEAAQRLEPQRAAHDKLHE